MDVDNHTAAVDIGDLQSSQLRAPRSSGIECHQQNAMKGSQRGVNKLGDFFRAQDDRQTLYFLGIRSLGNAPWFPQRLDVEESQSGQGAGSQCAVLAFAGRINELDTGGCAAVLTGSEGGESEGKTRQLHAGNSLW